MKINLALSSDFFSSNKSSIVSFPELYNKVCNPFFSQNILMLDSNEINGLYWPIGCLGTGNSGILFFLIRNDPNSIACWELDHDGNYLTQFIQPLDLIAKVFKTFLTDEQYTLIVDRCAKPFGDSLAWVADRLYSLLHDAISNDTVFDIKSFIAIDKTNPCLKLIGSNLYSVNSGIESLQEWLEEQYSELSPTIFNSWQQLCKILFLRPPQTMIPAFSQGMYCLLREIASIYIGRHILKDPFSKSYLQSCTNKLVRRQDENGSYRIIGYKHSNKLTILEVRGLGFLMQTDSIFLSSGISYVPSVIESESSWVNGERKDNDSLMNQAIRQSFLSLQSCSNADTKARIVQICNNSSDTNLGHFIWNDLNGICTFIKLFNQTIKFGEIPTEVILSHQEKSAFSDGPSYTKLLNPIAYELNHANASSELRISSIEELSDSSDLYDGNILHVSIKGWNLSQELADNYKSKLVVHPTSTVNESVSSFCGINAKVKLFVNVRGHNKSLTNIDECLLALIRKLSFSIDPLADLSICLEGSYHSKLHIDKLVDILESKTKSIQVLVDEPITALAKAISGSSLSIMPIGSGAVISTWICSALTVLHGDKGHRDQKGFWTSVSDSNTSSFFLPDSIFQDSTDKMYSSYRVDPEPFADEVVSLLNEFVLT